MNHRDFEQMLRISLQTLPQGTGGLPDTVLLAQKEACRKRNRRRISFGQFLTRQVRYIGWKFWGVQGLMLLLFDRMVVQLYGERFWDSPASVARLLFCLSTLVAMMALPLVYRSIRYRMQEVEAASWFSSGKLLLAKLTVIGIGDMGLLAGMFLLTLVRTSMQAGMLSSYLLLPFLTMTAACLYLMGHCGSSGFLAGSIAVGAGMILLAIGLPGRWVLLLKDMDWPVFCAVLLALCAGQLRYLACRSPYAQLQLM